jgi:hypothetical protein
VGRNASDENAFFRVKCPDTFAGSLVYGVQHALNLEARAGVPPEHAREIRTAQTAQARQKCVVNSLGTPKHYYCSLDLIEAVLNARGFGKHSTLYCAYSLDPTAQLLRETFKPVLFFLRLKVYDAIHEPASGSGEELR